MNQEQQTETLQQWINVAERIVVLTGAGVSTDSGIPDFRGPQGLWTRNPAAEKQSDIRYYMADPEIRQQAWQGRLEHTAWTAQPNDGHRALVELEARGQLHALVTQNIDGLHQAAGNSDAIVVEVHGTMRRVVCMACGLLTPMPEVLTRVRAGEVDPPCLNCGGIQKSDTISFGQNLVPEIIDRAMKVAGECDLLLALGTTLQVFPVASMVPVAADAGARVAIINADPTAMDEHADIVLHTSISSAMGRLVPASTQR